MSVLTVGSTDKTSVMLKRMTEKSTSVLMEETISLCRVYDVTVVSAGTCKSCKCVYGTRASMLRQI